VKPDFFKDEDLCVHPFWVRILFEGLWTQADREGRLEDRPMKLKAEIFPYDKNVDVNSGLEILTKPKIYSPRHDSFIIRYEIDGEKYIQIVNFLKHQSPHHTEKNSNIPPYNGSLTVKEPVLKGATQDAPYQETINRSSLSFKEGEWGGITEKDMEAWKKAYPACDVAVELKKMAEWIKANPAKGKKSNWRRFIVNWLARQQDRGGTDRRQAKQLESDDWAKRKNEEIKARQKKEETKNG
jgi:hypothetical protein